LTIYRPKIGHNKDMRFDILVISLLLAACVPKKGDLNYSLDGKVAEEVTPITVPVTFEQIKNEILVPKCLECHKWVRDEARVKRRIVPGIAEQSELFQSVESGEMPEDAAPLSTRELEMLRSYINSLLVSPE
jgi:hypothetical protein